MMPICSQPWIHLLMGAGSQWCCCYCTPGSHTSHHRLVLAEAESLWDAWNGEGLRSARRSMAMVGPSLACGYLTTIGRCRPERTVTADGWEGDPWVTADQRTNLARAAANFAAGEEVVWM